MRNILHSLRSLRYVENILTTNLNLFHQLSDYKQSAVDSRESEKVVKSNTFLSWIANVKLLADFVEFLDSNVEELEARITKGQIFGDRNISPDKRDRFICELQASLVDLIVFVRDNKLLIQSLFIFPSILKGKKMFAIYENAIYKLSKAVLTVGRKYDLLNRFKDFEDFEDSLDFEEIRRSAAKSKGFVTIDELLASRPIE